MDDRLFLISLFLSRFLFTSYCPPGYLLIDSCSCSSSACVSISSAYVSIGRFLLLDFSKNAGCGSCVVTPRICSCLMKFLISLSFRCSLLQWRRFSSGSARLENSRCARSFLLPLPRYISLSCSINSQKAEASVRLKFASGMSKWVDHGWRRITCDFFSEVFLLRDIRESLWTPIYSASFGIRRVVPVMMLLLRVQPRISRI